MKQRIACFVVFFISIFSYAIQIYEPIKAFESFENNQIIIQLQNGNSTITVNGKKMPPLKLPLFINKGCFMVSMDSFQYFHLNTYSNSDTNSFSITSPTSILKAQIGSSQGYLDNQLVKLNCAPIYYQKILAVPVKSIMEKFGATFEWTAEQQKLVIYYTQPDSGQKNKVDDGIYWNTPNPSKPYIPIPGVIDPNKTIKVEMWEGNQFYRIDGVRMGPLQQAPLFVSPNLTTPLEIFPVIFKIQTSYSADNKMITFVSKGKVVQWQLFSRKVLIDKKIVEADMPATIQNGNIYLPLPFMIHHLGSAMQWDVKNKKATILYDFSPYTEDPDIKPILSVSQTILDFGRQIPGSQPILSFKISNQNDGKLKGTIASSAAWIKLSSSSFNDQVKEINVILDIDKLKSNLYKEFIYIKSSGGNFTLPICLDLVDKKIVIEMQLGQLKARIDSKEIALPCTPFLEKSSLYVPLRFIAESFGSKIEWKANTGGKSGGALIIIYKDIVAVLETNKSTLLVNGALLTLKQPVMLKNGTLVCPIEAVMAIFHPLMDFDGEKQILRLIF
jgi:hypothetical protein